MTSFTIDATDLADGLLNVLPHTAEAGDLPVLNAVRVEVADDGLVTFVATDRYTLAIVEHYSDPRQPIEPGEFLITRADAQEIVKRAKSMKLGVITIEADADRLTVTTATGTFTTLLVVGEFPKYHSLLPEGEPIEVGVIGIGARNLAKFAKLYQHGKAIKHPALSFTFRTANKPFDVRATQLGDDYRAIVMPIRLAA